MRRERMCRADGAGPTVQGREAVVLALDDRGSADDAHVCLCFTGHFDGRHLRRHFGSVLGSWGNAMRGRGWE